NASHASDRPRPRRNRGAAVARHARRGSTPPRDSAWPHSRVLALRGRSAACAARVLGIRSARLMAAHPTLSAVAAFVVLVAGAPLVPGAIARTKAIFAGRRGPPVWQLYADLWKL